MASCNRLQGLAISLRREKSLMLSDFKVRCIILNRCGQNKPHPHHGIAGGRSSTICFLIYIPAVVDKINKMAPVCCCDRGTTSPRCDICVSSRMKALLQKACTSVWGTPRLFIFGKPFVPSRKTTVFTGETIVFTGETRATTKWVPPCDF